MNGEAKMQAVLERVVFERGSGNGKWARTRYCLSSLLLISSMV